MNHIGERIKYLRKSKNMTQRELGEILGVKKAAIQKYESSADPNLTADKIRLLCTTFAVYPRVFVFANEDDFWKQVNHLPPPRILLGIDHMSPGYTNVQVPDDKTEQNLLSLLISTVQLNDEGRKRVESYVNDLIKIDEYRAKRPLGH